MSTGAVVVRDGLGEGSASVVAVGVASSGEVTAVPAAMAVTRKPS
jgi:hypothetical protein